MRRGKWHAALAVTIVASTLAGACALELAGTAARDVPVPDGGPGPSPDSDVQPDGGSSDGAVEIDAGDATLDAPVKPDAAPLTWCGLQDAAYAFCADFDRGGDLRREWCGALDAGCVVYASDGGSIAMSDAQPSSLPNALVSSTIAIGATYTQSVAARLVARRVGRLRAQTAVRVDAMSNGSAVLLVLLLGDYDPQASGHSVALVANREPGNTTFEVTMSEYYPQQPIRSSNVVGGLTPGTWYRLELSIDDSADASGQTLIAAVDNQRLSTTLAFGTNDAGTRQVQVGIPYVLGPAGAWTVRTDDVLVHQP